MNVPAVTTDKQKELLHCLGDVWWRLDNLYFIEDEKGNKVRFRLRPIQHIFLMSMWFFNIILKARQLGFTTTIDIFILDRALFNPNTKCGIVAHTKDDVYKIFSSKIKFGYDNLPPDIKGFVQATSKRANEIEFTNGSSIRVAVSMRSGTLQCLHISEYGKVCAKYPAKAQEI
ncbi:MAG: terminase, partial [Pseudomonadales bacterium]